MTVDEVSLWTVSAVDSKVPSDQATHPRHRCRRGAASHQTAANEASLGFVHGAPSNQATDAIVDLAVQFRKPWAVVPCCVFPNLFTKRRTPAGDEVRTQCVTRLCRPIGHPNVCHLTCHPTCHPHVSCCWRNEVRTYEQLCEYLVHRVPGTRSELLAFEGRNRMLWWRP